MPSYTRLIPGPPRLPASPSQAVPEFLTGSPYAADYAQRQNRIPGGAGLEAQSSDVIAGLLGTPQGAMFADTSRMAAERGAGAGVPGSPNAFSVGLRMSDDERLKRIALGQEFLSGAYARQPAVGPEYSMLTAGQTEAARQADRAASLDEERLEMQRVAQELENQLRQLQIRNLGGGGDPFGGPIDTRITNDPLSGGMSIGPNVPRLPPLFGRR